jgi:hypothetical protein
MPEWSTLMPVGTAPAEVEAAKAEVEALRAKLPAAREALTDAQAAVTTAEADDRQRMAEALRAGRAATADTRGVEKAQQRVAAARREGEAVLLAIQASEDSLGETIRASRDGWLRDARRREATARGRAAKLIGELRSVLESVASERNVIFWLGHGGLDRQQHAGSGVALGELAGSEKITANGYPVGIGATLDMLTTTIEPQPQPTEPVAAA